MSRESRTTFGTMAPALLLAWIGLAGTPPAEATVWTRGDLFVGIGGGQYQIRDSTGALKETITANPPGGLTTGCAFNNDLTSFYGTFFSATKVVAFDVAHPHAVNQTIDTNAVNPGGHSESIVFAVNGHFYVGHPDGNRKFQEYDASGTLVREIAAAVDDRGTDWEDLTVDQTILFYTSEGRRVLRYDVVNDTQLPDFAVLPDGGTAYAVRLLPPTDGSGGLLVADNGNIKRLDAGGNVIQTYDVPGEDSWFALTLDPNGTSFWSANTGTSNVYRFNIATGAVEVSFNTGTATNTVFGLCQMEDRPPVALCKNVTVSADATCHASASVDNGSFDPDTPLFGDTITLVQAPPGPYSLGSTGVTLTVTDNIGKSAVCDATVTVIDTTPPAITCSANQVIECTSPGGAGAVVGATATDNCSIAVAPSCSPSSGNFPIGSTTVTCTTTDGSGNSSQCQSIVTVVDTTKPSVSCVESVNPSGGNVPPAGSTTLPGSHGGQNEDGFYKITGSDLCTAGGPTIRIGSFILANNETIKITQSPGQSGVTLVNTMGPLNIKHFQVGPGDAVITVTDGSGNVGTVACLVPPPPK